MSSRSTTSLASSFKEGKRSIAMICLLGNHPDSHCAAQILCRYDVVCPPVTAWDLHKKWPEAEFHIISDAGHSARESGIAAKLVAAAEKFKDL